MREGSHLEAGRMPYGRLTPDEDNGEGTNLRFAKGGEPAPDQPIPKFPSLEELHVVVAGGTAGRFSAVIPGWTFPKMSRLVIKKIQSLREGL